MYGRSRLHHALPGLLGVVLLSGCGKAEKPQPQPPAAQQVACDAAWASIPASSRAYNFATDAIATEQGNEGYRSFAERLPRQGCTKPWTILVYMAADNEDMPPEAYRDLYEMEGAFEDPGVSAASTSGADVLVQLDLREPRGIRRLHMFRSPEPFSRDLTAADLAKRTPRHIRSPIVELLDEAALSPGESLKRFLSWGVSNYPAERYMVVLWGHGLGWRPRSAGDSGPARFVPRGLTGGIAHDDGEGTVLDIPSLHDALASVSAERLGWRPWDVYVSDACLMQSLEVAAELSDVARHIVGSEQIEHYVGLSYRSLLPRLNGTIALPPPSAPCAEADRGCRIATLLPGLTRDAVRSAGLDKALETFTLSALDSGALRSDLCPALQRLAAAIVAYIDEDDLRRINLQVLLDAERGSGAAASGTPDFLGGTRDLGVFLARLEALVKREVASGSGAISPAVTRLLSGIRDVHVALDRTVIAAALGARDSAAPRAEMAGVSVWLPHNEAEFRERIDFFASSWFYGCGDPGRAAGRTLWRDWLARVFKR